LLMWKRRGQTFLTGGGPYWTKRIDEGGKSEQAEVGEGGFQRERVKDGIRLLNNAIDSIIGITGRDGKKFSRKPSGGQAALK